MQKHWLDFIHFIILHMISLTFYLLIIIYFIYRICRCYRETVCPDQQYWSLAVIVCDENLASVVPVRMPTRSNDFSEVDSETESVYLTLSLPAWFTTNILKASIPTTLMSKFRFSHMVPNWAVEKRGWPSSSNWLFCLSPEPE